MPTVYLETSIISYLTARPSGNVVAAGDQLITREWWDAERDLYELLISDLVILEASAGDPQMVKKRLEVLSSLTVLEARPEAEELAQKLILSKVLPEKAAADAAHISIATVNNLDYL